MNDPGVLSYGLAATFYLIFAGMLLTSWRGRQLGGLLVSGVVLSLIWTLVITASASFPDWNSGALIQVAEALRYTGWFLLLFGLLRSQQAGRNLFRHRGIAELTLYAVAGIVAISAFLPPEYLTWLPGKWLFTLFLLTSVVALWLLETLFRNTKPDQRWGIKYLVFGLGGMFAYDFFLFSNAVLFGHLDMELWQARGAINALVVPMLAVTCARNPDWSLDIFVSRRLVHHTATLIAAGFYLLVMAGAGYYIRSYSGEWGVVFQIVFLFGAGLVLLVLLFSGHARARLRVFLSKHFFNYQYDYREEWLRFTRALSSCRQNANERECVMQALATIVDSPGGVLWLRREAPVFHPVAHWSYGNAMEGEEPQESPFIAFLQERHWVINLDELEELPERYGQLEVPAWLASAPDAWLIVPLFDGNDMLGFVVLARPLAPVPVNWEVLDLLKTAAGQAASHLAQMEALEALAQARQFEGFNRLSAFLLHDLKNIIAQQSIIVRNAAKHKQNPEFIDDAVGIMQHSVNKMNRLLTLLRGGVTEIRPEVIRLDRMIGDVIKELGSAEPQPLWQNEVGEIRIVADPDRMRAVIRNLVQNAQQATERNGQVKVSLADADAGVVFAVEDDGGGMSEEFVRERLFKPFDTTKGDTGMGIGAYESREYIRTLGGCIEVWSEPEHGSRFMVMLPSQVIKQDSMEQA